MEIKLTFNFTKFLLLTNIFFFFQDQLPSHPVWSSRTKVAQLATSMVLLYVNVKKTFTVDDKSHYTFTPKHLTEWCLALVR